MFTVKLKNNHGWTIRYADEVRIGEHDGCPTVVADTCASGGGQHCTLITMEKVAWEGGDVATDAYIENGQGQTTHIVRAGECAAA